MALGRNGRFASLSARERLKARKRLVSAVPLRRYSISVTDKTPRLKGCPMDKPLHTHARVPVLDLLRLAAVVAVILYHYGFWGPVSATGISQVALPALAPVGQYGFLGVSVFFAISGFVIAYSAEGQSWIGFIIARFS